MKSKRLIVLIISLLLILLVFSCSKKTTESETSDEEPIVTEETQVIPSTTGDEIIEITDNTVVLPSDTNQSMIQEGNIIVSAPTDAAPDGLLRKVIGYEEQDGQIVVITEHARLEDAFDQLDLSITQNMKTTDIRSSQALIDGIVFHEDSKNPYNFSYTIDEDFDLGTNVSLGIDGDLDLTLGYEFMVKIGLFQGLHYIKAGSFVTSNGDLGMEVNGSFDYQRSIELYEHYFAPFTFFAGPVPIVLVPKAVIVLNINAEGEASVSTSVSASATLSAGVVYDKPDWTTYQERSLNFDYIPPSLTASMESTIDAGPRFEINLYGVAGPWVYGKAYLKLDADTSIDPWWTLTGGYAVDCGVKFEALGYVNNYTVPNIINHSTVLAEAPRVVATPIFSPAGGPYTSTQNVTLSCSTPNATIRYTTNGSEPTSSSTAYSSPINVSSTTTIKAKAFKDGWTPSATASATYTITPSGTVATPTFSPAGGTYTSAQNVTISCATSGATIFYSTNGSTPSIPYNGPINIGSTTTLKAKATKTGWNDSSIASAIYTINIQPNTVATPTFSPAGGTYTSTQNVSIATTTANATIRYTTNGSEPTSSSTAYSSPINVSSTTTIKAKAFKDGWTPSATASATYTIDTTPPPANFVFVPGGTFTMGDTRGEGDSNELPTHSVTLNSFYIGKYEVTQAEYAQYMQPSSSWTSNYGLGDNYPAYYVSWYAILKYCNLRSMAEGLTPVYSISGSTDPADWGSVPTSWNSTWNAAICNWNANGYRLPTEAEWEYAARGATNTPDYLYSGSDDINTVAWYYGNNPPNGSKPVGSKAPNGLGLYDMSGNLWELCWDWYSSSYYSSSPSSNPTGPASGPVRVLRGGCWNYSANRCRVASRNFDYPYSSFSYIGFRLCRAVP
jgi:formylglycine-generating enzyme required for sulfatase activity